MSSKKTRSRQVLCITVSFATVSLTNPQGCESNFKRAKGRIDYLLRFLTSTLHLPGYFRNSIRAALLAAEIGDTLLLSSVGESDPTAVVTIVSPNAGVVNVAAKKHETTVVTSEWAGPLKHQSHL
jgi:hypothetical protein